MNQYISTIHEQESLTFMDKIIKSFIAIFMWSCISDIQAQTLTYLYNEIQDSLYNVQRTCSSDSLALSIERIKNFRRGQYEYNHFGSSFGANFFCAYRYNLLCLSKEREGVYKYRNDTVYLFDFIRPYNKFCTITFDNYARYPEHLIRETDDTTNIGDVGDTILYPDSISSRLYDLCLKWDTATIRHEGKLYSVRPYQTVLCTRVISTQWGKYRIECVEFPYFYNPNYPETLSAYIRRRHPPHITKPGFSVMQKGGICVEYDASFNDLIREYPGDVSY